jgi:phosphoenolpyruvate carboxykinase (diphosphate)
MPAAAASAATSVKSAADRNAELIRYINLKLAALGQPTSRSTADPEFLEIAGPLLRNYHQKDQLLANRLCPADTRIQSFLESYFADERPARLPVSSFVLDREGMARIMSLPASADVFSSPCLKSYRVAQGVLHNPKSDKRTTQGLFHIAEGGLPVPADKVAVPKQAFAALWAAALQPPDAMLVLPFTADQDEQVRCFVSLLLRPLVCPAAGQDPEKTMEIRFVAPGSLVSNLDFVESIFGNGGDPYLPENDAALDALHWTGHTGCVVVAPHLVGMKKKDLGLPHISYATERQRRDGMCWESADEPYNGGSAFKITCRDGRGVMVTILADNYYGYCKKEVKTQISFAANLFGLAEEEHAGGAMVFATYVLGQEFHAGRTVSLKKAKYDDAICLLGDLADPRPEGYAKDKRFPDIYYVPEDSVFNVLAGSIAWRQGDREQHLTLRKDATYFLPNGFRIRLEKQTGGTAWRLVGARPRVTLCHKPCTVSGGGKSEISKSIANTLLKGPVFVNDYHRDMDQVAEIFARDFSGVYRRRMPDSRTARQILSPERTMGSVIQLMTPSAEHTDEHNDWLRELPPRILQLLFTVKRYYQPEWGENWREHFTVDRINGVLGHELKLDNQLLVSNYLRVGFDPDGSWRVFKLRPDFHPADKVAMEDDITASVVLPRESLNHLDAEYPNPSVKLVANCERRLFQRPDDAIHRGEDRQAEADIAGDGNFFSNYEAFDVERARALVEHVAEFDRYTEPMKARLESFLRDPHADYVVSSAHPRVVNGAPSSNPRYLQPRPDLVNPRDAYLAQISARLEREIPAARPVYQPVNAVLAGRRNSPADPKSGTPPLAIYGPVHYQELPELFMDFVASLTGKSPATTGFGSEGALTKGPFNALWPVVDLNNALVSWILTGYAGFTTSAGYAGPNFRVDHDVSLLVPEIWCRMRVHERDPEFLKVRGYLEPVCDFCIDGRTVLASRLGYRITELFVDHFLGRIFETPAAVFPDAMLRPEKQDIAQFAAGVDAMVGTQKRVALQYFEDGSVDAACPPLKALLHIMAQGSYEGMGVDAPEIREMFTRQRMLQSDWYRERLETKQWRDIALWTRHVTALEASGLAGAGLRDRLEEARLQLARARAPAYLHELAGTIGADPFHLQLHLQATTK